MANSQSFIGKQIGSYRIESEINSGSFGSVYKGQHIVFDDEPLVAIKILHNHLNSQEEQRQFFREAQLLKKLKHPSILTILDAGIQDGVVYLVTEYAAGGSLHERIRQQKGQSFPLEAAITILTQIGDALNYAHQNNIVHRDLKPGNILFNAQGEALLADFGLATILGSLGTTVLGSGGTPAYMAPEQFQGIVSTKSDQYALGCIAYELVTGHKPFNVEGVDVIAIQYQHARVNPDSPTSFNPTLPLYIELAILKAMAKDRTNRHREVSAFVAALQKTAQQWIAEADALRKTNHNQRALEAYEQALLIDPNNALAHHFKGKMLYRLNRLSEALNAHTQAIKLDSYLTKAYIARGLVLEQLKQHMEALSAYAEAFLLANKSVQSAPTADAYAEVGEALSGLNLYKEALALFEQAIHLDPTLSDIYINKGYALYNLKQYEEELAAYEQAIRLDPNLAMAYNNKGATLNTLKRYAEAFVTCEQAIHLDPYLALAYRNKGDALLYLKRYEEALSAYEQTIRLDPNDAYVYSNKGYVLLSLNRYKESLAVYEQAIHLDPEETASYNNKCYVLLNLNRYTEALAACEQAIRLDPNSSLAYSNKAVALEALGRTTEAQQAREKAKQLGG